MLVQVHSLAVQPDEWPDTVSAGEGIVLVRHAIATACAIIAAARLECVIVRATCAIARPNKSIVSPTRTLQSGTTDRNGRTESGNARTEWRHRPSGRPTGESARGKLESASV